MFLRSIVIACLLSAASVASAQQKAVPVQTVAPLTARIHRPPPPARIPAIKVLLMGQGIPEDLAEAMKICEENEVNADASDPDHIDPDGALEGGSVTFKFKPGYEKCAAIRATIIQKRKSLMSSDEAVKKALIDNIAKELAK